MVKKSKRSEEIDMSDSPLNSPVADKPKLAAESIPPVPIPAPQPQSTKVNALGVGLKRGKATIDVRHLVDFRREMMDKVSQVEGSVSLLTDEVRKTSVRVKKVLTDFITTPHVAYKVGRSILTKVEEVNEGTGEIRTRDRNKLECLDIIHQAIYVITEILTNFQVGWYDDTIDSMARAESLSSTLEVELKGDDRMVALFETATARNEEVRYLMRMVDQQMILIKSYDQRIKAMIKWASKQLDILNRYDSLIRLKTEISRNLLFPEMTPGDDDFVEMPR